MCVSSNIDIAIDIECECGGNKILYFQQKVGSNQEVQQIAKGKKQETH